MKLSPAQRLKNALDYAKGEKEIYHEKENIFSDSYGIFGCSTHCVTTIRKYCWECGASEDSQATSVGGCTWWCTMTHWNDRRDPRT